MGPAAIANAFIAAHTMDPSSGKWFMCPHCQANHGVRQNVLVPMVPAYLRSLVACDPWGLMLLSFIESPITLSSWSNSFTHGRATGHLWDSPLIHFGATTDGLVEAKLDRYVLRVLQVNMEHINKECVRVEPFSPGEQAMLDA